MKNPWKSVPLEIYEAHMRLSDVAQLQALNRIMLGQVSAHRDAKSAAIIGVAGGNGLEHFKLFEAVYGIDVNPDYLKICAQRFQPSMGERLRLLELNISEPKSVLPAVDLIVANLLIEYVGTKIFCDKIADTQAKYVSCVIQCSDRELSFVSDSPYQTALQDIGALHHDVDESELTGEMAAYGYSAEFKEISRLPNGKQLIRIDYWRKNIED